MAMGSVLGQRRRSSAVIEKKRTEAGTYEAMFPFLLEFFCCCDAVQVVDVAQRCIDVVR